MPGGLQPARLYISPGFFAGGGYGDDEEQSLESLELPVAAGQLDAALCSELIRDVSQVLEAD